ncbi:MAG: DUF7946 domain-containing protein [Alphaproteobacteria bacterium]
MGEIITQIELSYRGKLSDSHILDFYDSSHALIGLQRSISIVAHFVINREIITQSNALKGAKLYALPVESGSWKIAALLSSVIYTTGTAATDTPLGHIFHSTYGYVISSAIGAHVDYDKSIGQLIEEMEVSGTNSKDFEKNRIDSVIEKCETSIKDMHRPIIYSETANNG